MDAGDLVYVESRISNSNYEREGEQIYATDVIAQLFNLVSKKAS
jgi:single-stranded DNA-binding protein